MSASHRFDAPLQRRAEWSVGHLTTEPSETDPQVATSQLRRQQREERRRNGENERRNAHHRSRGRTFRRKCRVCSGQPRKVSAVGCAWVVTARVLPGEVDCVLQRRGESGVSAWLAGADVRVRAQRPGIAVPASNHDFRGGRDADAGRCNGGQRRERLVPYLVVTHLLEPLRYAARVKRYQYGELGRGGGEVIKGVKGRQLIRNSAHHPLRAHKLRPPRGPPHEDYLVQCTHPQCLHRLLHAFRQWGAEERGVVGLKIAQRYGHDGLPCAVCPSALHAHDRLKDVVLDARHG
mmetsp:Transcript_13920/g.24623  ORF Transcript_13920/g.24623 Transcript_13920/m.24623 type:complete len:292 (-) Transcript_13920:1020-1895(-)